MIVPAVAAGRRGRLQTLLLPAVPAVLGVLVACTASAAAGAGEDARPTQAFTGETAQGRDVTVVSEQGGPVRRLSFGWKADCGDDGSYRSRTTLRPPFDRATRRRFGDAGRYSERDGDVAGTVEVDATARRAGRGWRGSFSVSVVVRDGDDVIARCRTERVTFRARRPSA